MQVSRAHDNFCERIFFTLLFSVSLACLSGHEVLGESLQDQRIFRRNVETLRVETHIETYM